MYLRYLAKGSYPEVFLICVELVNDLSHQQNGEVLSVLGFEILIHKKTESSIAVFLAVYGVR